MTARRLLMGLGGCALLLLLLAGSGRWGLDHWQHDWVVGEMLTAALVYGAALWLVGRHDGLLDGGGRRRALFLILGTAAVARALLLPAPPLSTDIYRYVWDGRVAAAGINPYRYRPADPALASLREGAVYPRINRAATAVTIYPPAAQWIFWGVTRIADSVIGMKTAMVAFECVTVGALLALLYQRGLPATRVLAYAWHPLPLFEFAGSGHIDAAAIALMLLAAVIAERRRPLLAGAVLGAAALVKFFPAVIAPALYRRWGWRLPVAFAVTVLLAYLPYLGVGRQVLGFLPGYAEDEGLVAGTGFFLLGALNALTPLPGWAVIAYLAGGAGLLAVLAGRVLMRRDPAAVPMVSALALLALFTLWLSPHLAWYFTWIIPFLCFKPSWALIYLSAAAPLLYDILWTPGDLPLHAALYLPFAVIAVIEHCFGDKHPHLEPADERSLGSRHAG